MKRKKLVKLFEDRGWRLKRHGWEHDVYTDGEHIEFIPRHADINEILARHLVKKWNLDEKGSEEND